MDQFRSYLLHTLSPDEAWSAWAGEWVKRSWHGGALKLRSIFLKCEMVSHCTEESFSCTHYVDKCWMYSAAVVYLEFCNESRIVTAHWNQFGTFSFPIRRIVIQSKKYFNSDIWYHLFVLLRSWPFVVVGHVSWSVSAMSDKYSCRKKNDKNSY